MSTRYDACLPAFLALLLCLSAPTAWAQEEEDEDEFKVEAKAFEIADGLVMKCLYYPSNLGKNAVPILCLHGEGGSGDDFSQFATTMQEKYGHAVIVPDLRGHGKSTVIKVLGGNNRKIEVEDMNASDYKAIVLADLEEINKFLLEENNAGNLNINRLTVVGAELGSLLAMNWAALDWTRRQLPAYRLGQNVKAVALLTPDYSDQGMSMANPLKTAFFRGQMGIRPAIMIAGGISDPRAYADSKRIHSTLERFFPEPESREDKVKYKNLFLLPVKSKLQGTKLLDPRLPENVPAKIQGLIKLRILNKADDFPWEERQNPLG